MIRPRKTLFALILLLTMALTSGHALAGVGYHYSGPLDSAREDYGVTARYKAFKPSTNNYSGFVVDRVMLQDGGWLEVGITNTPQLSSPTVYTCGGDQHGCPGNGTQMYGKLYTQYPLTVGTIYRFRAESCFFSDNTWGTCAYFSSDGGVTWSLLDWRYNLCKSNRKCGAVDTQTEVWLSDNRHPALRADVPHISVNTTGGETQAGTASYVQAKWSAFNQLSNDLEYPLTKLDSTYINYKVERTTSTTAPALARIVLKSDATASVPSDHPKKANHPGSEPPSQPRPGLPRPVGAEDDRP